MIYSCVLFAHYAYAYARDNEAAIRVSVIPAAVILIWEHARERGAHSCNLYNSGNDERFITASGSGVHGQIRNERRCPHFTHTPPIKLTS